MKSAKNDLAMRVPSIYLSTLNSKFPLKEVALKKHTIPEGKPLKFVKNLAIENTTKNITSRIKSY